MVRQAVAAGATLPEGCQGRECGEFCKDPRAHTANAEAAKKLASQCLAFAKAAGFMEDVPAGMTDEVMIAMMMGGMKDEAGNVICRGPDCEEVCSEDPEVCMAAMERLGVDMTTMIPPEAIGEMKQGLGMMKQGLAMAPPSARACIDEELAPFGVSLAVLDSGDEKAIIMAMMKVGPEMEGIMRGCIEEAFGGGGFPGVGGFGPPGMGDEEDEEDEDYDDEYRHGDFPGQSFGGSPTPQDLTGKIIDLLGDLLGL